MEGTNQIVLLNKLLMEELDFYKGMTTTELKEKLSIERQSKNINAVIFQRIISNSKKKEKIDILMNHCKCIVKTVNLEWNNNLKESMSLNVFKYCDIVAEEWESSTLRDYFLNNIFVFVVLKKDYNDSKLIDIKLWKMPLSILDSSVKDTWLLTQELIKKGKIVNYIDNRGRNITYFPTTSETKYIHVRPHAQNANDALPLPVEDKVTHKNFFTKHSFWLNSSFVKKIVVEDRYYD